MERLKSSNHIPRSTLGTLRGTLIYFQKPKKNKNKKHESPRVLALLWSSFQFQFHFPSVLPFYLAFSVGFLTLKVLVPFDYPWRWGTQRTLSRLPTADCATLQSPNLLASLSGSLCEIRIPGLTLGSTRFLGCKEKYVARRVILSLGGTRFLIVCTRQVDYVF